MEKYTDKSKENHENRRLQEIIEYAYDLESKGRMTDVVREAVEKAEALRE